MAILVRQPDLKSSGLVSPFVFSRLGSTRAVVVALFCTFSEVFDVPVYWPILVLYFCVLFALTMRRQIQYVQFPCYVFILTLLSDT